MNTVKFVVGSEKGEFIKKEFEVWSSHVSGRHTFEVLEEEDGVWMYITIEDFNNLDALTLFHAGQEVGSKRIAELLSSYSNNS